MTPNNDPLLTETETAKYLNVSIAFLRKRRWLRLPPHFLKVGGTCVRYKRSELEAFIAGVEHAGAVDPKAA